MKFAIQPSNDCFSGWLWSECEVQLWNVFFILFVTKHMLSCSSKEKELRRGIIRKNSFWDTLIFKKVQDAFGGQLRLMVRARMQHIFLTLVNVTLILLDIDYLSVQQVVGSAPLAGNVLTFMRCSLGCLVVEGYGQTGKWLRWKIKEDFQVIFVFVFLFAECVAGMNKLLVVSVAWMFETNFSLIFSGESYSSRRLRAWSRW